MNTPRGSKHEHSVALTVERDGGTLTRRENSPERYRAECWGRLIGLYDHRRLVGLLLDVIPKHMRQHLESKTPAPKRVLVIVLRRRRQIVYVLRSSGTLPPLAASLFMTCLCSQMFMDAESFMSPV